MGYQNGPFSAKNAPHCRILHIKSQILRGYTPDRCSGRGNFPRPNQHSLGGSGELRPPVRCDPPRCLDTDTNFPLARQRSHCSFLFYETTIDNNGMFARRPHSARADWRCSLDWWLPQYNCYTVMATIHDLNRFLLRHGNKWPHRFVQTATQHSDGIRVI